MTRVLVLGATGMLGSMVLHRLRRSATLEVLGTVRRASVAGSRDMVFDVDREIGGQLAAILETFDADLIINGIGVINRYCRDDDEAGVRNCLRTNALFPHELNGWLASHHPDTRVVHATTDCVFSGRSGPYDEEALHDPVDFYGRSKSVGEVRSPHWLNIRSSIIGPEVEPRGSLLEWFLSQPRGSALTGFAHHLWNGVTTLQFAELCEQLADPEAFARYRALGHTVHYCPNSAVSKFELLQLFDDIYGRGCTVEEVTGPDPAVDRRLASVLLPLPQQPMRQAVTAMKAYTDAHGFTAP